MPRLDPTGRGADRLVATTVATATRSPSCRQRSSSGRISFTLGFCLLAGFGRVVASAAMSDQASVSLLRWLRRQLREPTPWRERLEAAVANDDPVEARRLLARMEFTDAQRHHVAGLIDRWEEGR